MAKIAFITRTKDRVILLERAIESILNQSFYDIEMVIVNDGGKKEGVESLVEKYKEKAKGRIKLIHNEKSLGMEAASNVGIKNSNSEFILIHDDDDSLHPIFSAKMIEHFNAFPASMGAICWSTRIIEEIQNNKVQIVSTEPFNNWLNSVSFARMLADNTFPPISFMYKRAAIDKIGLYDESLPVLGDWDFNVRFMMEYDIDLIKHNLAYYHHRLSQVNGSLSNSVIGGHDKHVHYQNIVRNKWLRNSIKAEGNNLGAIVFLSKSFETLHENVNYSRESLNNSMHSGGSFKGGSINQTNSFQSLYDNISFIRHFKYKFTTRFKNILN